jgi:hypothetical protein
MEALLERPPDFAPMPGRKTAGAASVVAEAAPA